MATHIAVMEVGRFVGMGAAEKVLEPPESGYTKELLAAVPEIPRASRM